MKGKCKLNIPVTFEDILLTFSFLRKREALEKQQRAVEAVAATKQKQRSQKNAALAFHRSQAEMSMYASSSSSIMTQKQLVDMEVAKKVAAQRELMKEQFLAGEFVPSPVRKKTRSKRGGGGDYGFGDDISSISGELEEQDKLMPCFAEMAGTDSASAIALGSGGSDGEEDEDHILTQFSLN